MEEEGGAFEKARQGKAKQKEGGNVTDGEERRGEAGNEMGAQRVGVHTRSYLEPAAYFHATLVAMSRERLRIAGMNSVFGIPMLAAIPAIRSFTLQTTRR